MERRKKDGELLDTCPVFPVETGNAVTCAAKAPRWKKKKLIGYVFSFPCVVCLVDFLRFFSAI